MYRFEKEIDFLQFFNLQKKAIQMPVMMAGQLKSTAKKENKNQSNKAKSLLFFLFRSINFIY